MQYSYIDENYLEITKEIEKITQNKGNCEIPKLLVAIKSAEIDEIEYLCLNHKVDCVGENRVQQLLFRYDKLKALGVPIHFIGSLQTNKVKYIIDKVDMIHSLDRVELAREIDKQAKKHGKIMDVLIEINSAREENKGGIMPENLEAFCEQISVFENIKVCGFMTMGKKSEKKCDYLKYFCETYQLVLDIWQKKYDNIYVPIISMGMSESFPYAVEAGSNLLRIGRKMFIKKL